MARKKSSNGNRQPKDLPAPDAPSFPPLYRNPEPLTPSRHSQLRFGRLADFSIARGLSSLPINVSEFLQAQVNYPIVFSRDDLPFPLVMLGRTGGRNLFIDDEGTWLAENYIPAYVRRYPFILTTASKQDDHILCIDTTDPRLNEAEGERLYDGDDKASKLVERAAEFCTRYHRDHLATRQFCEALKAKGLFEPGGIRLRTASGKSIEFGGYNVVSHEKFVGLPDGVFLEWRRAGWIGAIYAHLLSVANWQKIGNRILKTPAGDERIKA